MDGFFSAVAAGVVAALVSAVAAYYFGGLRERQKQTYDRQRDEQTRQEEKQKELNERRAEALDEIRRQAYLTVEAHRSWAAGAAELKPSPGLLESAQQLIEQGNEVSRSLSSLTGYYQAQKPRLSSEACRAFESFAMEFNKRQSPLLEKLRHVPNSLVEDSVASLTKQKLDRIADEGLLAKLLMRANEQTFTQKAAEEAAREMAEKVSQTISEVHQAADLALDWHPQTYLDKLVSEA